MSSTTANSSRNETLRRFQRDVTRLLNENDRDYLHDVLQDFQAGKNVEKLIATLRTCLDTPKKLDLLIDIRELLPSSHRAKFDSLAPYHKMSKPFRPAACGGQTSNFPIRKTQSSNSLSKSNGTNFHVVNLHKDLSNSSLGFSIRGGHEFGTGVYVSSVDQHSSAAKQGLSVGDQIIECNGVNFEDITHASAVQMLSSAVKFKLVLCSEGKVPEFNEIKSGFSWVDSNGVPLKNMNNVDGSDKGSNDQHSLEYHPNINLLNSVDEKRINFTINIHGNAFIGFNLRGGKEYGLGMYVSKVDRGSAPEQAGLQVGDLILDVNGTCFENIAHQDAVNTIKSQEHIMMTVKSVGIIPAAKLFYSDVSWVYPDGTVANVAGETTKQDMSTLTLQDSNFQHQIPRSDSSTQVNMFDLNASTVYADVAIQAAQPPQDTQTYESIDRRTFTSTPTQTPDLLTPPASPPPPPVLAERPIRMTELQMSSHDTQPEVIPHLTSTTPYEALQSVSPFVTSETTKTAKLKGGDDNESTWSTNDRSSSGSFISNDDLMSTRSDHEDAGHKGKVKKSKSFLQKQGDKIKAKLSFRKKGGSKPKLRKKGNKEMMSFVDERCRKLLVPEEYHTVMTHIKKYKGQEEDVERLVNNLSITLDTPRKAILLRDIRAIVVQYDVGRYDAMISNIEVEALEFYGKDAAAVSPAVEISDISKPKKTLVEAVQDSRGNFQLRTTSEAEEIKKQREELKKERLALKSQGSSILEREASKNGFIKNEEPFSGSSTFDMPATTIQVIDLSSASPGLSTFGVPATTSQFVPDFPTVHVTDDTWPGAPEAHGYHLAVPDRLAIEYRSDVNENNTTDYFSFDLPKIRTSVGISISGGCGSRAQPEIRVEKVFPGGAAADDGTLQSGWKLISIDDDSLEGASHAEAVDIIRRAYNDKSRSVMKIVCVRS